MNRSVLLTLALVAVVAGCNRREESAPAPETDASSPAAATDPAPPVPVPADPATTESAPAEPPPATSAPALTADESAAAGGNGCNAEPLQSLVGQLYTPELGEQARVTAGARVERALRPGQIVTMEFRADRLSFTLDEKGRVSAVNCG